MSNYVDRYETRYIAEEDRYEFVNPMTTLEIKDYRFFKSTRTSTDKLINKLITTKFTQAQLNEIAGSMAKTRPEVTKVAIEKGAILEKPCSQHHDATLFYIIICTGDLDLIEFAIINGANVNYSSKNTRPIEAIFTSLEPGQKSTTGSTDLDVIDLLLRYQADPTLVPDIVEKYFSPYASPNYNGRSEKCVAEFRNLLNKYTNGKYANTKHVYKTYDVLAEEQAKADMELQAQKKAHDERITKRMLKEIMNGNFY